jgi:hypothetical protein
VGQERVEWGLSSQNPCHWGALPGSTHIVLRLHVRASLQQQAGHLQLTVCSREVEGRPPVLVGLAHVRLVVQEQAHHVQVAPAGGLVQGGVAELVHHTHVCPPLQEQLHHRQVVVHGRVMEGGTTVLRKGWRGAVR